jgi:hypothetical protein
MGKCLRILSGITLFGRYDHSGFFSGWNGSDNRVITADAPITITSSSGYTVMSPEGLTRISPFLRIVRTETALSFLTAIHERLSPTIDDSENILSAGTYLFKKFWNILNQ